MSLSSVIKHGLHCVFLISIITLFLYNKREVTTIANYEAAIEAYGIHLTILLYVPRIVFLFSFPPIWSTFLGLVLFNAFPDDVKLKRTLKKVPFICFRVVTRGDYPDLIRVNVSRNLRACHEVGIDNFIIEVVTEKFVDIPDQPNVRQTVVPYSYRTKTGALFRGRNLQYCLEDDVNFLDDEDFIVHLDEETLMTTNAIRGIANFAVEGRYDFGAGLITFGKEEIVNLFCTLADGVRISDDMGRVRFELLTFHKPLSFFRATFFVAKKKAECQVSFDHGPEGSITEDAFFGRIAVMNGYSFNFIPGEMWEQSPFTLYDLIKQRKRWIQGLTLVVLSSKIPLKNKLLLVIYVLSWYSVPFNFLNVILSFIWPLPIWPLMETIITFYSAVYLYTFIFGVLKGFSLNNVGICYFAMCILGACLAAPFYIVIEIIALTWGAFGEKIQYDVVCKDKKLLNAKCYN